MSFSQLEEPYSSHLSKWKKYHFDTCKIAVPKAFWKYIKLGIAINVETFERKYSYLKKWD